MKTLPDRPLTKKRKQKLATIAELEKDRLMKRPEPLPALVFQPHEKIGYPVIEYTEEHGKVITDGIAAGVPMVEVCKSLGVSTFTVSRWQTENADFNAAVGRARENRGDLWAAEIERIVTTEPRYFEGKVDSGMVAHNRLKFEALRFLAGKYSPKTWGEKIQLEAGNGLLAINISTAADQPVTIDGSVADGDS